MGRFMALVILPLLLSQILSGYIFYNRHWRNISNQSATLFAGNVMAIVDLREDDKAPEDFEETKKIAKRNFFMDIEFVPGGKIARQKNSRRLQQLSLKYVDRFLERNVRHPYSLSASEDTNVLEIQIQYPDGVLDIKSSLKSVFSKTIYIYAFWVLGSIVVFLGIAIVFARSQVDSIKKLTNAIDRAGRGEDVDDFKPAGPNQVREAGLSFLRNNRRQRRYLKSRNDMLAGISHDLKTPLTRMKLEMELFGDKTVDEALASDVEEMEKMLDAYLAYARGNVREASERVDVAALLANSIRKANKGKYDITLEAKGRHFAVLRPIAFERAVANVLSNAIRYSDKKIIVSVRERGGSLEIDFEDNGKGIPAARREEMLKPFTRLEGSRNRATGGVGLGLAIVQETVHQHGGDITLGESSRLGGLLVRLEIPLK
jgi:two-component system osmolarity sensor histidine kinase EnvZ